MTSLLPFALDYAQSYGWAVHPVNLHKKPTTAHGFKDATRDEPTIREYFKNGAQLSIATGSESSVFVFDVDLDVEKGIDGYATLAALEAKHGPLPRTPHQKTGRGGTQYLFNHVPGLPCSTNKIGRGIDTRGDGGYAVVAPSHNTNGAYEWIVSPADAPLADVPQWILLPSPKKNASQAPRYHSSATFPPMSIAPIVTRS
jgi:putative DNA primase/helicase